MFSFEQTNFYIDFIFQGLRAFLPKFELMDRINTFSDLKNKVNELTTVYCSSMCKLLLPSNAWLLCITHS